MIGPMKTGTLRHAVISAVAHEGLTVKTPDGRPARLAVVDEAGQVVECSPAVALEAFNVAIASYKRFMMGQGHLRVYSAPLPGIGDKSAA